MRKIKNKMIDTPEQLGEFLDNTYSEKKVRILEHLVFAGNKHAEVLLISLARITKIKDRNKRAKLELEAQNNIDEFLKNYSKQYKPSGLLLSFFLMIEVEVTLSCYFNRESTYKEKLIKKNENDYHLIKESFGNVVHFTKNYETIFSESCYHSWDKLRNALSDSIMNVMKFKESVYDSEILAEKLNEFEIEDVKNDHLNEWLLDEFNFFNKIKNKIQAAYELLDLNNFQNNEEFKKIKRAARTILTKTLKKIEKHQTLILDGVEYE